MQEECPPVVVIVTGSCASQSFVSGTSPNSGAPSQGNNDMKRGGDLEDEEKSENYFAHHKTSFCSTTEPKDDGLIEEELLAYCLSSSAPSSPSSWSPSLSIPSTAENIPIPAPLEATPALREKGKTSSSDQCTMECVKQRSAGNEFAPKGASPGFHPAQIHDWTTLSIIRETQKRLLHRWQGVQKAPCSIQGDTGFCFGKFRVKGN